MAYTIPPPKNVATTRPQIDQMVSNWISKLAAARNWWGLTRKCVAKNKWRKGQHQITTSAATASLMIHQRKSVGSKRCQIYHPVRHNVPWKEHSQCLELFSVNLDCGAERYSNRSHMCCQDTVAPRLDGVGTAEEECCGTHVIDNRVSICCDNVERELVDGNTKCCGEITYDSAAKMCCKNKLYERPSILHRCCDDKPYDSRTHSCEKRVIVPLWRPSLLCLFSTLCVKVY
jgi:hypothetical protein